MHRKGKTLKDIISMAKSKNSADDLFPTGDGGWSAAQERSSKFTTKDLDKMEAAEDKMIAEMSDMIVTNEDKSSISEFQKKLFGGDGNEGLIKTGNKGISRKKLYEELMTTLELNGIAKTHHVSEVVKQSILAILG